MKIEAYHPVTRWLHLGLMLGVLLQLSSSLLMTHPDEHGGPVGKLLMELHQLDGLAVAAIVLANLLWALMLRGSPEKRQVAVLFSRNVWKDAHLVLKKLPAALTGKTAFISPANSLSLIVEMLGLLAMSGMAITGILIWFNNDAGGGHSHEHVSQGMEILMTSHALLSKLLWLYVVGHVSMAIMHMRAGARPFARILPFGK